MAAIKVITYNLNGLRAALSKGFTQWLASADYDVVMIQETKAQKEQVDMSAIEALGYHHYWFSAEKKGYSGVCTLTRILPEKVVYGSNDALFDAEGRTLQLQIADVNFINCYFPSGSSGDARQEMKMVFLQKMISFIEEKRRENPRIVLSGDFNICHRSIDIHDPVGNKNTSGFLPEERAWMEQFFQSGFRDAFRQFNQEPHQYTWWSQRFPSVREQNKGWRIDYNTITDNLSGRLIHSAILPEAKHSDHCPVFMELDL